MKLGKASIHDLIEQITEEKKQSRDFFTTLKSIMSPVLA